MRHFNISCDIKSILEFQKSLVSDFYLVLSSHIFIPFQFEIIVIPYTLPLLLICKKRYTTINVFVFAKTHYRTNLCLWICVLIYFISGTVPVFYIIGTSGRCPMCLISRFKENNYSCDGLNCFSSNNFLYTAISHLPSCLQLFPLFTKMRLLSFLTLINLYYLVLVILSKVGLLLNMTYLYKFYWSLEYFYVSVCKNLWLRDWVFTAPTHRFWLEGCTGFPNQPEVITLILFYLSLRFTFKCL